MFVDTADNTIVLNEVVLRDGIQNLPQLLSSDLKLQIVNELIEGGMQHIQVTSFVNPNVVPQMADAEDLIAHLPLNKNVNFSALVLNSRGLDRALETNIPQIDLSLSCSNTHSLKNTKLSQRQAIDHIKDAAVKASQQGYKVRLGLQSAFGCHYEGPIPTKKVVDLFCQFAEMPIDCVSLADSTGMAMPQQIQETCRSLLSTTNKPIILHLHDTLGLGLANFLAAIECGIRNFDTSIGGLGGCPFIPNAAGNIATEDIALVCSRLGLDTGINLELLLKTSILLGNNIRAALPGKIQALYKNQKLDSILAHMI